jgi:hypothetical protein
VNGNASADTRTVLRHVLTHLLVPILLAAGMALAYLGAFHQPRPQELRLDVVGSGPQVAVLASTLQDQLGDAAAVRTVPTVADARGALVHRQIAGAYVPDPVAPRMMIASAASGTTALTVEKMLTPVALAQGLPLRVDDVAAPADTDTTGQGIFFYLVALSVGSYSGAIAIAAAGARLAMRLRALLAVGAGALIALVSTVVAGPLYGALPSHAVQIGLLGWAYSSAVVLIGVGLHTFLGRWTTPTLVGLFVMLNFTTSGGIFAPDLQPGFFAALHSWWIGTGVVEGGRNLLYFPALGIGRDIAVLLLWLAGALVVVGIAALGERRRTRALAAAPAAETANHVVDTRPAGTKAAEGDADDATEEELEESVPVG